MKLKYEFMIRQVAGENVLIPMGKSALSFSGMVTANDVGAFICEKLQRDTTREELLESEILSVADEKLYQEIVKDVTLTEEDLIAAYDGYVATAKADYEYDIGYFESDVNAGAEIYYYPAGYRYVKHILIAFPDEEYDALSSLRTERAYITALPIRCLCRAI